MNLLGARREVGGGQGREEDRRWGEEAGGRGGAERRKSDLGLLWGGGEAGAYRPDRLVGQHYLGAGGGRLKTNRGENEEKGRHKGPVPCPSPTHCWRWPPAA